MKNFLSCLLALFFVAGNVSAQDPAGSDTTFPGDVTAATDTDNDGVNDEFVIDLGGGITMTVDADGVNNTQYVGVGSHVKYSLAAAQPHKEDDPRTLKKWVNIGPESDPDPVP